MLTSFKQGNYYVLSGIKDAHEEIDRQGWVLFEYLEFEIASMKFLMEVIYDSNTVFEAGTLVSFKDKEFMEMEPYWIQPGDRGNLRNFIVEIERVLNREGILMIEYERGTKRGLEGKGNNSMPWFSKHFIYEN